MNNTMRWLLNLWGKKSAKRVVCAWSEVFDLNNEDVKIVLKDLAIYCNFYKSSFVKGDINLTNFNEGARDVFLHIMAMAKMEEKAILEFLQNDDVYKEIE